MKMKPKLGPIAGRMVATGNETATSLATASGVSRWSVGRMLGGAPVTLGVASRVADALGATVPELFECGASNE